MVLGLTVRLPWLAPHSICLLCGCRIPGRRPLCPACEADLPWLGSCCRQCALPLPVPDQLCPGCHRQPPDFALVAAAWRYGFPVDSLIIRFKHHGQWPMGRLLGLLLAERLQQRFAEGLPRPDALVPVPLSAKRLRERGFNQAELLAQVLAKSLGIPIDDCLRRVQDGPHQQQLNARQRRRNLRGAFAMAADDEARGRHLALVDDVVTTGSTANVLAGLLLKHGASRVDVYSLARTPAQGMAQTTGAGH